MFEKDEFGNVWPKKRPIRSAISAEHFAKTFVGCLTVAIHIETDEIYAGGKDERALQQGFSQRNLDPTSFQLEPGPMLG